MKRGSAFWMCLLWALVQLGGIAQAHAVPANAQRFTTTDGLPSNVIHAILEDRHGYLWFASDDGLARFDGRRFRIWRREQGLPDNRVLALAQDVQGQLWLGTSQGQLVRLSADRQQVESFDARRFPSMGDAPLLAVLPDDEGAVWFGTQGQGLFRLGADRRLRQFLPTVRGDGVPDRVIEHLVRTADGSVWVGTPGGLARWREGRFSMPSPALLAKAPVTALLVDGAGRLWVGGAAGPWRADRTARLEPLDLAVGTRALGVARHGDAWLADGAQVWRQGDASRDISLAALTRPLPPRFRSVFEDRHGGLWLLGRYLGVWRLPPHWQEFRPVSVPEAAVVALSNVRLEGTQSFALQCPGGTRWILDARSVQQYRSAHHTPQRWVWDDADHARPAGAQAVHCDGSDGLWWGSAQGVRRWVAGRFLPTSVSAEEANALHVTDDGALWVAGPGVLRRYRISEGALQHSVRIDDRHGLPPLRFRSLATDAHGGLWVTSARGLLHVKPREGGVRLYTRTDGVPAELLSARLLAQGRHMLALDNQGGGTRFDPLGLVSPTIPPALVMERVQVHRDGRLHVVQSRPTVQLKAGDRDIQITVRRLGPAVETQQYRFRLQGVDRDWIRVGRRGTRGFPHLPPGQFRLEFQARQPDGHWSGSEWVQLVVERGAWHHPLLSGLRMGVGVLLVSAAACVAWRQLQRMRSRQRSAQRRAVAEQSAQAKAQYLATLGHEIRTPLTGVLGLSELLLASPLTPPQRQQLERVRQGGQTLLHVLNRALDEARIEAGSMPLQAQNVRIDALCRRWQARSVLALCPRGTGVTVCVHVREGGQARGDPARLMQLLDEVAEILVIRTACTGLVLQVWWQAGRERLLLEVSTTAAQGTRGDRVERLPRATAVPTPSRQVLDDALADTHGLVRALGGSLRLHATGAGRWTVLISLALPAVGVAAGMRALVVDSDPVSAQAKTALLQSQGHHGIHVSHALAALAELQEGTFDLVVLALDLPGVGGLALLEMIRAGGIQVPILVAVDRCDGAAPALAATQATRAARVLRLPASAQEFQQTLQEVLEDGGSS